MTLQTNYKHILEFGFSATLTRCLGSQDSIKYLTHTISFFKQTSDNHIVAQVQTLSSKEIMFFSEKEMVYDTGISLKPVNTLDQQNFLSLLEKLHIAVTEIQIFPSSKRLVLGPWPKEMGARALKVQIPT